MRHAFIAELKKILTIRSTYIILGICVLLELLFAFYIVGWHMQSQSLHIPQFLSSQVTSAVNVLSLLFALVTILLVTHEYRHNTISYTLTASKSRTRVFIAKFLAVTVFALFATLLFALLSPLLSLLAVHLRSLEIGPQEFSVWSLTWRAALAGWGFSALAFVLAMLIRIQVGAIVAIFLIPSTVESLLGLLLKGNQVYLPFSSLNILLDVVVANNHISYVRAAVTSGVYIVIGLIISWIFFLKRDAN